MVTASDLREGMALRIDHEVYRVLEMEQKAGAAKAGGAVRARLSNAHSGLLWDQHLRPLARLENVELEKRKVELLHSDAPNFIGPADRILQAGTELQAEFFFAEPKSRSAAQNRLQALNRFSVQARTHKEGVMAIVSLIEYLDEHRIRYVVISHSPAYTAQGIAGLTHISGKELAKSVIVKLDGNLAMAVLPAKYHVDLPALSQAAQAKVAMLASEYEFQDRFPECELGAMSPFGNLYGMPVFADVTLEQDKEIAFNAGTHRELIRMAWEDFKKLVEPRIFRFAAVHSVEAA